MAGIFDRELRLLPPVLKEIFSRRVEEGCYEICRLVEDGGSYEEFVRVAANLNAVFGLAADVASEAAKAGRADKGGKNA